MNKEQWGQIQALMSNPHMSEGSTHKILEVIAPELLRNDCNPQSNQEQTPSVTDEESESTSA